MPLPVVKSGLDNGLTVVLREMHHAPVTSFWIWYRVGSRNELPGITGASHWVEHMMFKGSPQFPPGSLERLVSREGGRWNAFTTNDFTAYFETLPSDRIDLALRLESDRMVNAILTEEDVEAERTVIISERHMYENHPSFLLREELIAAAHSGCFSMALSHALAMAGHIPKKVATTANVHLDKVEEGFKITTIELVTEAEVPDISESSFMKIAEEAKVGCPVSQALQAVEIKLQATLKN